MKSVHESAPGFGVWRSWLARAVWDREVEGSNPFTPTIEKTYPFGWVFSYGDAGWAITDDDTRCKLLQKTTSSLKVICNS